ncbi:MAG: hypothetical protein ACOYJX_03595 [Acutalibacteraceae bacterium]|jgi:hypothetical protein
MKRLTAIILATFLVISLVGCGGQTNSGKIEEETEVSAKIPPTTRRETTTKVATTAPPVANVKWKEGTIEWTNKNGYTFRATIRVAPWLFWTDPRIESVWGQISKEPSRLPRTFEDWGLRNVGSTKTTSGRGGTFIFRAPSGVTDLYYLIGTVKVENVTNSWRITAENSQVERIYLFSGGEQKPYSWLEMLDHTPFVTAVFYGNTTKMLDSVAILDMDIKADSWGPVPFIIACAENFSPKFPDGECHEWIEKYLACDVGSDGKQEKRISIPLERDIVR